MAVSTFCSEARRQAVRGTDYRKARAKALFRDRYTCTEPGCTRTEALECHHCKPLYLGGDHSLENLQTLCHTHRAKHKRWKEAIIANEHRQTEGYYHAA